jgi:hypothetical protein
MFFDKAVWKFISKNKPADQRPINLEVNLFLGYLRNGTTWYSADDYCDISGSDSITWRDVNVQVLVGQTEVYSGTPTTTTTVSHIFQDSEDLQDCEFRIVLTGLSDQHAVPWTNGELGGVALHVTGQLENMPLQLLMPKFGKYFVDDTINVATEIMGQNGYQQLYFQLPFYSWLHQNRELIVWELTYPNGYPHT